MPISSEIGTSSPGITLLPVQKIAAHRLQETTDPIAIEEPLEIRLRYGPTAKKQEQSISITMRTPGHDEDLALGWLYTEGILPAGIANIAGISNLAGTTTAGTTNLQTTIPSPNTITVTLPESIPPDLSRSQRHSFTTSSCGVCGQTSLEAIRTITPQQKDTPFSIPAGLLYPLPALLREGQDIFDATGGLHAAGLFDRHGNLIILREDIGRHNAVDKVIGHTLLHQGLPLSETILLLSGRACFELIQKAAMAGIRIVAAVGPPSSLAIRHAEDTGITLVGFLRQQRFNIYSGSSRIEV